jgi:hypothetical protein
MPDSRSLFRPSFLLLVALLTPACDKSPSEPFARLLEHAASWAAAARYADQLHARGEVPATYLRELIGAGRPALQGLRSKIATSRDIPADEVAAALSLTDDLLALFTVDHPDAARMSTVEAQLRQLAAKARRS